MSYEQQIAIVKAIREAVPLFSHHQEISKRIIPFIQSKLATVKIFGETEYVVYMNVQKGYTGSITDYTIQVWGNGLLRSDCITLQWNNKDFPEWEKGLSFALNIADMSDYQEREEAEQNLIPLLETLDRQVRELIKTAQLSVSSLPIPPSATVRAPGIFWQEASRKLSMRFPLLFNVSINDM